MAEIDYEVTSSDSDLGDAPELKSELLILPEWLNKRGKATAFYMCELDTGEHDEFEDSDKEFDKFGQVIRLKRGGKNYRWLRRTTRDGDGNPIWLTDEVCEKRLKPLGKSITNKMVQAANKVNYGDATDADEATASAEGNSEEASSSN